MKVSICSSSFTCTFSPSCINRKLHVLVYGVCAINSPVHKLDVVAPCLFHQHEEFSLTSSTDNLRKVLMVVHRHYSYIHVCTITLGRLNPPYHPPVRESVKS